MLLVLVEMKRSPTAQQLTFRASRWVQIRSGRSCGWKELPEELISDNAKFSEPPLPMWH